MTLKTRLAILLRGTRKTERGAGRLLTPLAVRAASFALLGNTRKTERGAARLLTPLAVRAASFALLAGCVVAYSQEKLNPNFTGGEVKTIKENSQGNTAHFYFGPGARTKWHSHEGGQIILVEEGVGLYQEKGGPVVELRAGETHYCPPGVVHWHGASPKEGGAQFNVSRGGITWLAEVTDEEFNAPSIHK